LIVTREEAGDCVADRHAGAKPDLRVVRSDLVRAATGRAGEKAKRKME
jgi:hypothetical protein